MKAILLVAILLQIGTRNVGLEQPAPQFFKYQRSIVPSGTGPNCAVLDADVFAHAAAALRDLRLYSREVAAHDLPYAITLSEPEQPDTEPAGVLNLGTKAGKIVFDLAMPNRPYSSVTLDLAGRDFLATAIVTGVSEPGAKDGTRVGEFTLFDLSSQHLSRGTMISFEESTFPYLHVEMSMAPAAGYAAGHQTLTLQVVLGASVPPSREAQSIYMLSAESRELLQDGRKTIAKFHLPQRVPVERVTFVLDPAFHANFSRDVTITARPADGSSSTSETVDGNIFHVQMTQAAREIRQERLSIGATLGSNLQSAAEVEVAVKNGDDRPLPIQAVQLEMRQRRMCFDAKSGEPLTLFYGDAALQVPQYDFGRTFSPSAKILEARVGPEQKNPIFRERPDTRAATERHPELVWIVFLAVVCVLAIIALRSSRHMPR